MTPFSESDSYFFDFFRQFDIYVGLASGDSIEFLGVDFIF